MSTASKAGPKIDGLALWIFFSCWCSLTGWTLSSAGCLNRDGYAVAALVFPGALFFLRTWLVCSGEASALTVFKITRTGRWIPKLWLALTVLSFVGGLLYHPVNYDHLTYRFPRILFWSWEQKWHWLDTFNPRMNYSAAGFEWMMTPLFILFQTDRLFFLLNFTSSLFLPGLIFPVFRSLGISARVSWWWMWVLPCGYCYILQAAGAANDAYAAVYLLASLHYAFKKGPAGSAKNPVISTLAVALMTGAKASNLPLVLPWAIALFFTRRHFFTHARPGVIAGTILVAALVSFLPMGILNTRFAGDYSGDPHNISGMKLTHPVSGVVGNALQIAVSNLAPPIWTGPVSWEKIIPAGYLDRLRSDFPRLQVTSGEMQTEEGAGVGIGVVAFAAMTLALASWAALRKNRRRLRPSGPGLWIVAGAFVALLAYMAKMGSESASRLVAGYYPLAVAGIALAASLDGAVVRNNLYKIAGTLAMLSAFPLVVLSPLRPLIPVAIVSRLLEKSGASPATISRFNQVYEVYSTRFDGFGPVRGFLPESERIVGFVHASDDPVVSLWLPFGSRQVVDLSPDKSVDELKSRGIHYVVVNATFLEAMYGMKIDDLIQKWPSVVVIKTDLVIKIHRGAETWYLLHLL